MFGFEALPNNSLFFHPNYVSGFSGHSGGLMAFQFLGMTIVFYCVFLSSGEASGHCTSPVLVTLLP